MTDHICGYHILKVLGKGGQGTVYLAEHEVMNKRFALKITGGEEREQLRREAAVMKEMTDRRIPYLVDQIESSECTILVMEYVEGTGLEEYLKREAPLEEDTALDLLHRITEIVAYLHGRPEMVAHRDLKPGNFVIAGDGSVHLLDYGCALTGMESLRRMDRCGTPGYAAPEQMQGARSGTEADVYSLGAIYAYMLTGIDPTLPPFHPPKAEECPEGISRESRQLLHRILDPEPEKRLPNACQLLPEIDRVKKRKRHWVSEVESLAYHVILFADLLAAIVLVFLRYFETPNTAGEGICGGSTLMLLFWYLLRSIAGPKQHFVIAREWNVTYTDKKMWGL